MRVWFYSSTFLVLLPLILSLVLKMSWFYSNFLSNGFAFFYVFIYVFIFLRYDLVGSYTIEHYSVFFISSDLSHLMSLRFHDYIIS